MYLQIRLYRFSRDTLVLCHHTRNFWGHIFEFAVYHPRSNLTFYNLALDEPSACSFFITSLREIRHLGKTSLSPGYGCCHSLSSHNWSSISYSSVSCFFFFLALQEFAVRPFPCSRSSVTRLIFDRPRKLHGYQNRMHQRELRGWLLKGKMITRCVSVRKNI